MVCSMKSRRWFLAIVCASTVLTASTRAQPPDTYAQKTRTFHSPEEFARATGGKVRIERTLDPAQRMALLQLPIRLPATEFTVIHAESPSVTWIGTRQGAIRLSQGHQVLEYFAGERWLPADHVTGIGFDGNATWLETSKGFARIEYRPMTLAEKSRAFVTRVQARHNRWGLTSDSQLRVPGDVSTNQTVSSDNDGLWTAMYVAAECFRYRVTGEPDARENARAGMQAIMRLEAITGIPGFPARSFIKVGVDVQPKDGEWHDTPDKVWRWKGDTSSDEIVGHYFVYPIYYDLAADEAEKPALRGAIDRITTHILDNGYQLIDVDGKRTRWGWWGPEAIWENPDETGLRALHMLSQLRVALHLTGDAQHRTRYQAAYDDSRQHAQIPLADAQSEDHGSRPHQPLGRRAGVSVVLSALALRDRSEAARGVQAKPGAKLADRAPGAQPAVERHLRGRHVREGIRSGGIAPHAP